MADVSIIHPKIEAEIAHVRRLCRDYRAFLMTLGGTDAELIEMFYPEDAYEALLDGITDTHAAPGGSLRLAVKEGAGLACGMYHTLRPGAAEIKRVYVAPEARGTGLGRAMIATLLEDSRAAGFETVFLDTSKRLTVAAALYTSMGFAPRGPYSEVPDIARPHLLYFEYPLSDAPSADL